MRNGELKARTTLNEVARDELKAISKLILALGKFLDNYLATSRNTADAPAARRAHKRVEEALLEAQRKAIFDLLPEKVAQALMVDWLAGLESIQRERSSRVRIHSEVSL